MDYKKIAAEAWIFTQENKGMVYWLGSIPAFFTTLFGIGYLLFQIFSFQGSILFENWPTSFTMMTLQYLYDFLSRFPNALVPLIIGLLLVLSGNFILPILTDAALIQMVARKRNKQVVRIRHGLSYGMMSFLPLFEYKLLVRSLSAWSFLGIMAMAMRSFGWSAFNVLFPFAIVIMIVGFLVEMLLTYADLLIVIDNKGVFAAIAESATLVAKHLEETIFLSLLMLLIAVRILIQLVFVLLIPSAAIGVVYLFTAANLPQLATILGSVIGGIMLLFAAYFNGVVHVFAVSVWTFSFLELTSKSDLSARDKIEEVVAEIKAEEKKALSARDVGAVEEAVVEAKPEEK